MFFFSKDLWTSGQGLVTAGIAYVSAQCGSSRYAIAEEHGGLDSIVVSQ